MLICQMSQCPHNTSLANPKGYLYPCHEGAASTRAASGIPYHREVGFGINVFHLHVGSNQDQITILLKTQTEGKSYSKRRSQLSSARIPDALHLLPLCSPPTALSHGLSLISLAAPGCFWLLLVAFCMLLVVLGLFSRFWKASWDSPWRDPKIQVSGGCLRALGK